MPYTEVLTIFILSKLLASIGPQIDPNVFNERYLSGLSQDTYLETAVNLASEFGCEVPDTNEILRKVLSNLKFSCEVPVLTLYNYSPDHCWSLYGKC